MNEGRRPARAAAWLMAARPRTLTAAIVPVAVGTALAFRAGHARWGPALAALAGALLIQIGTNLFNDYYDFVRGADTSERVGPVRVTQAGLLAPRQVLFAAWAVFAAAFLVGLYLVAVGGWPIVGLGLASLGAGWAYTGGPAPLGYLGLGELFVFVFFGLVAVGGTYFVQAGPPTPEVMVAAVAVGALATALLVVNNLRDRDTDARAGKRTLAVRLGERAARIEYGALVALAFAAPPVLWASGAARGWIWLAWLALPLAVAPLSRMARERGGALNPALGATARLQLAFGLLFAVGLAS